MFGFFRTVHPEQSHVLSRKLVEANIQHGDEAEIKLIGVGIHRQGNSINVAFCPAKIQVNPASIQFGGSSDRLHPFPLETTFDEQSVKAIKELRQHHGFATVSCNIRTNGLIHIRKLQVVRFDYYGGVVNTAHSFDNFLKFIAT